LEILHAANDDAIHDDSWMTLTAMIAEESGVGFQRQASHNTEFFRHLPYAPAINRTVNTQPRRQQKISPARPRGISEGQHIRQRADRRHDEILLDGQTRLQSLNLIQSKFVAQLVRMRVHQGKEQEYGYESGGVDAHKHRSLMPSQFSAR